MNQRQLLDLATRSIKRCELDELENIARTHENLAYRYRSAVSLLRQRLKHEEEQAGVVIDAPPK